MPLYFFQSYGRAFEDIQVRIYSQCRLLQTQRYIDMAGRKRVQHTIEVTFDNNLQKDAFLERLTKARQYLSVRGLSADNNTVLNSMLDAADLVLPSTPLKMWLHQIQPSCGIVVSYT